MLLRPENVELTKINYYNEKECKIYTISRRVERKLADKNRIIKRNIFGHKWVLKVNEKPQKQKKRCTFKVALYLLVFLCILIAIASGIYFTIESKYSKSYDEETLTKMKNTTNIVVPAKIETNIPITIVNPVPTKVPSVEFLATLDNKPRICKCNDSEVCLKINETSKPKCIKIKDVNDPTGCGGHCKIHIERCKHLHSEEEIYQCVQNKNVLVCSNDTFNCGNMCILLSKRCDGIVDCAGQVDEKNCDCNLTTHFQCGKETSCVELSKKCNGIIDCWDRTDETGCYLHDCESSELPCSNGQCIPKEAFCDGTVHCTDKSDEPKGCYQ